MKTFLIIPAYNEEKRIGAVVEESKKFIDDIVVVDDGSTDKTYFAAKSEGVRTPRQKAGLPCQRSETPYRKPQVAIHPYLDDAGLSGTGVTVLRHEINLGKGAALTTGCEYAFLNGAEAIIMMDSDGQHRPEDLPKFLKALNEGHKLIIGSRYLGMGMPLVRIIGNKFASFIICRFFGIYATDLICGFRAFTKDAYKKIKWESTGYGVETEMIARAGLSKIPLLEVPVQTVYIDKYKGVSFFDAYKILFWVLKWRLFK